MAHKYASNIWHSLNIFDNRSCLLEESFSIVLKNKSTSWFGRAFSYSNVCSITILPYVISSRRTDITLRLNIHHATKMNETSPRKWPPKSYSMPHIVELDKKWGARDILSSISVQPFCLSSGKSFRHLLCDIAPLQYSEWIHSPCSSDYGIGNINVPKTPDLPHSAEKSAKCWRDDITKLQSNRY